MSKPQRELEWIKGLRADSTMWTARPCKQWTFKVWQRGGHSGVFQVELPEFNVTPEREVGSLGDAKKRCQYIWDAVLSVADAATSDGLAVAHEPCEPPGEWASVYAWCEAHCANPTGRGCFLLDPRKARRTGRQVDVILGDDLDDERQPRGRVETAADRGGGEE